VDRPGPWHPVPAPEPRKAGGFLRRYRTDDQAAADGMGGEAAFATWAYRVAANHILNFRKCRVEQENLTFGGYGEELERGLADPDTTRPDAGLLAEEVKLGCTLGMLLCLDRDHRLAYILTDVCLVIGTGTGPRLRPAGWRAGRSW
jgi:DNA-directed RNA polymerase specialized sigma24 family protein